ncbi:hypothetical protein LSH36_261g01000 [Paralvinella palmiformis]|uniref:C1q domain-containing protein n=1 Tax=Paralvinella palmiformis TaxID=53620 RepID=A0AAD9JK32_9ANNE|nr:hypothetical protein LSH36_261g01000 [Paralvinella palmiformis]
MKAAVMIALFLMSVIALVLPVATYVARTTDLTEPEDPVPFTEEIVNMANAWNRLTHTLTIPKDGVYFFHLNAGALGEEKVSMELRGAIEVNLVRESTAHTGTDTLSRDIIQQVSAGTTINIVNVGTSKLFSDAGRQTSFTAFSLQDFQSDSERNAFSVSRQDDYDVQGELPFTEVLLDTSNSWDNRTRYYIPKAGLYFFTFSCGVKSGQGVTAQIRSDTKGVLSELYRSDTNYNGADTLSGVAMANLEEDDYVYVNLVAGELYSDIYRQVSFGGFQYNPKYGTHQAWSVYRTSNINARRDPLDPLPFQGAEVNTGLFDFDDDRVHIVKSGVYYIHLNVGVQSRELMKAHIVLDDTRTEAEISRSTKWHNGEDVLGQGMILELFSGNTLKVVLEEDSYLYSDSNRQTVFSGFLIFPYLN